MNTSSSPINLLQLFFSQIIKFINPRHFLNSPLIRRSRDGNNTILDRPFKQDIRFIRSETFGDFGEDGPEWSAGVSEDWAKGAVGLGYDIVFLLNVDDGLGVGEEVGVELHFWRSALTIQGRVADDFNHLKQGRGGRLGHMITSEGK